MRPGRHDALINTEDPLKGPIMTEKFEINEEMLAQVAAGFDPETGLRGFAKADFEYNSMGLAFLLMKDYAAEQVVAVIKKSERVQLMLMRKDFLRMDEAEIKKTFAEEAAKYL